MKQKLDSRLPLSEGGDPPLPPSPPSRHDKWKLARIRPLGSYTFESAKEISERIQHYEDYGNRPPPSPVAEHVVPPTEAQIPLYLHHQDVRELVSGREEINITLIQLWVMYMFDVSNKKGFNDVYGFIDPSMTHERNKFDDIKTYITICFGMGKEIYFLPYIHGCHWQLLVISIPENTAVWFCSLQKSSPNPLRHVVDWCDFTAGANGGREELVGTSPPLPLGLLLLPSSMFVSFRVLHGSGDPDSFC
ncbi:hypothetical protein LR48_Vigan03g057500 [Vigna angularis]|uniref:Ubiquitin-like protease family profile domain-containing protein n=1 Tax=Phaseolus angularis TaxID=3914 RepID=A0A0L9U456_PHAAN|nr:hypothetical protein LR48_Vigan03g057500 [Vigna angularis]